jgi:hypothetical protein
MKNKKKIRDSEERFYIVRTYENGIMKSQAIRSKDYLLEFYLKFDNFEEFKKGLNYGYFEVKFIDGKIIASVKEIDLNIL